MGDTLENILKEKHNLEWCTVKDTGTGRIEVIVADDISEDDLFEIEDSVDEYFGDDWEGVCLAYNVTEYRDIRDGTYHLKK